MASKTTKFIPTFALVAAVLFVGAEAVLGIDIDLNSLTPLVGIALGGGSGLAAWKEFVKREKGMSKEVKEFITTSIKEAQDATKK